MRVLIAALTASLIVPPSLLSGQQPLPLESGERVRMVYDCGNAVMYSGGRRINCTDTEANVTAMTNDSIILAVDERTTPFAVPLASVTSLEVVRGQKRRAGRGALIGLGIGAGAGAIGGAIAEAAGEQFCIDTCGSGGVITLVSAAFGGLSGLVIGTAVGAFIKTDHWEEVPLDRLRVSFAPQRDRFAFGLRVTF